MGCHTIAKRLNSDSTTLPGRGKRAGARWTEKTVWNILYQEKYVGRWKYRQTKVVKNPANDTLVQQDRPKNEHIIAEREDLRIIPVELERRVNERKLKIEQDRQGNKTASFYSKGSVPKHLFVGSLKCASCGGNLIVVTGNDGGYMGCFNAYRESSSKCDNRQTIKMAYVEEGLLDELKSHLNNPEIYKLIAKKYNEHMGGLFTDVPRKLEEIESQIFEVEAKVKNYDRFISEGHWSDIIATNLKAGEEKLKTLRVERDYLKAKSKDKVFITPAAIQRRMSQLNDILGMAMPDANAKIRKLFPEKITMAPVNDKGKKSYIASGAINFYGMVDENENQAGVSLPFIKFERRIERKVCPV